jgi:hypothetical protein
LEEQVHTQDIVSLIRDILESIDNTETGKSCQVIQYSDEILAVEIGDKRFRIEVRDMTKLQ